MLNRKRQSIQFSLFRYIFPVFVDFPPHFSPSRTAPICAGGDRSSYMNPSAVTSCDFWSTERQGVNLFFLLVSLICFRLEDSELEFRDLLFVNTVS